MKVLLDTNVLLRMAVVSHPTHAEAVAAVYRIRQRGDQPAIVPQVLYEYWVVATPPLRRMDWVSAHLRLVWPSMSF